MIVLADTHALHWWLADPSRLSQPALQMLRAANDDDSGGVLVSVASRIDLHYLVSSNKITAEVASAVWAATRAMRRMATHGVLHVVW